MLNPFLDEDTLRLSGFQYVLGLLAPVSPYGLAAKRSMQPFTPGQEQALSKELNLLEDLLRLRRTQIKPFSVLEHLLSQLTDWRDALRRMLAGAVLTDVELFQLKQLLYLYRSAQTVLQSLPLQLAFPGLKHDFSDLEQLLDPEKSGSLSFYVSDAYSRRLGNVRREARRIQQKRQEHEQEQDRLLEQQVGQRMLPSGEWMISKFDQKKRQQLDRMPNLKVSRETYTDIYYERELTAKESDWVDELRQLKDAEFQEEERVREELTVAIRARGSALNETIASLGLLDLTLAKVRLADQLNCSKPQIAELSALELSIRGGRHPKVEQEVQQRSRQFTPVSLRLKPGVSIITGANMGGKTVTLRLVGLLSAMAQYGLLVPADELTTALFEGIRLIAGEYSADTPGLSRFGSEVESLLDVLPYADQACLLLYDELASSTNPAEGAALAQAIIEYLLDKRSISLFTTHYESLSRLEGVSHWQVVGLSKANQVALAEIVTDNRRSWRELADLMDYNLQPVPPGMPVPREALRVAKLMGMPEQVAERAAELLVSKADEYKN